MVTATGVLKAYNHCLDQSQRVLGRLGYRVHQENARVKKNGDVANIYLNHPLYFEDWPFKSQTKHRIDILADVKETVRLSDGMCIKSSVVVNYFLIDGERRIACDAIKYDFDEHVQPQHPICHAQNANKVLSERPERFPDKFDQSSLKNRHQATRIPTAFVNLAGLLEKLTADHLSNNAYDEFWSLCDAYVDAIPCHSRSELFGKITESNSVRSRFWYPR